MAWSTVDIGAYKAEAGGGGASYTLTADTAAYTGAFVAASVTAQRKFAAAVTSYTTTFNDATLTYARSYDLTAETVAYTGAFVAAGLTVDRGLTAAVTSYTTTINDATLTYNTGYTIAADTVAYTTSFVNAGLTADRTLSAGVSTYTTTVNDAGLNYGSYLVAGAASYTTTVTAANFALTRKLVAANTSYTTTINDSTLTYAGAVVLTVTCTLVTRDGTALPGLSALSWAWFDSVDPGSFIAPADQGEVESTDGTGQIVVEIPNTTLVAGQLGTLVLRADDGSLMGAYNMAAA